jgi:hypothetical protein
VAILWNPDDVVTMMKNPHRHPVGIRPLVKWSDLHKRGPN